MFILNSADRQTSKIPEWGSTPTVIVLGEINLSIIQERIILVAGGYKKQAPRLGKES